MYILSGYGSKHTTEECPEAIFIMCLQSIVGVMIQAFMVGVVFAKLSRPKKRTQTLLFSRNAVICQRDGILCLMFRVGDMRKSHIIEAHVRAQLIKKKVSISILECCNLQRITTHTICIMKYDGNTHSYAIILLYSKILSIRIILRM